MATQLIIKKWGNSMGAIFPKEITERENLKENQKIIVEIVKRVDIRTVFGTLKRKMSGQEFKELVKKEWN